MADSDGEAEGLPDDVLLTDFDPVAQIEADTDPVVQKLLQLDSVPLEEIEGDAEALTDVLSLLE